MTKISIMIVLDIETRNLFGIWNLIIGIFILCYCLFLLAFDPGRLTLQVSQVEELGASHLTPADHIDPIDPR